MNKKIKSMIFLAAFSTTLLAGCSTKDFSNSKKISISPIHASFSINVDNLKEIVGDADYVFVAYVNEKTETVYKDKRTMETENGTKEVSSPYTNYSITVIDNIKGKLKKNDKMPIQQSGGLSKDGTTYHLYENDSLLTEGKYYILSAYAQPDGSLLISGPNSSRFLNCDYKSEIVSTKDYKEYVDAFKNEVKTNRQRFKTSYEE